jgi:hypothetical protein
MNTPIQVFENAIAIDTETAYPTKVEAFNNVIYIEMNTPIQAIQSI